MKKINVLLLLLIGIYLSAQNDKNVGWYIQEQHFPEIVLPKDYKTYSLKIVPNNEIVKLTINGEQKQAASRNSNISSAVKTKINLDGFTLSETPDMTIEIVDLGVEHKINVEEKRIYEKDAQYAYTGVVTIISSIKVLVKDKDDKIIYDKIYTQNNQAETASVYNNFSIKTKEIALSQIIKQYNANSYNYESLKNGEIAYNVVYDIGKSLKSLFSTYNEEKRINLFQIKNEEKFGIDNNTEVDKLTAMNKTTFSENYNENLKKIASDALIKFESELAKITDNSDKNQKKIMWSLMSNISGVYYALGNYDKAIEFATKRMELDYNRKWTYNLEIAQKRKTIIEKIQQ